MLTALKDLLHLDVVVLAVAGDAEVDVDLGAEHGADALRVQAFVQAVSRDDRLGRRVARVGGLEHVQRRQLLPSL